MTASTFFFDFRDGDVLLSGYFAVPEGTAPDAKVPTVVLFPEWRGHSEYVRCRARMLADLGYLCFAADPYGKGVYAKDHEEAGKMCYYYAGDRSKARARARANLQAALSHPNADNQRVVVAGYCFGGMMSLELARDGAPIRGAASFHGMLSTPTPQDAKNIVCKILACHGGKDRMITEEARVAFHKEMDDANVDYVSVNLGSAMHSFTVPEWNMPEFGAQYSTSADRRSWVIFTDFIHECMASAPEESQILNFLGDKVTSSFGAPK